MDKFILWLDGLRAAAGNAKIILLLDNLSVHKSKRAKKAIRSRGFRCAYNVPYAYWNQPIEMVFSQAKAKFKALRARKMMGLTQEPHETLVARSFQTLKKKDIEKCVLHCEKLLR